MKTILAELAGVEYVGKESHRLEEVNAGLIHDHGDVEVGYGSDAWQRLQLKLHEFTARELAEIAGVSTRHIKAIRNGQAVPSSRIRNALLDFLRDN